MKTMVKVMAAGSLLALAACVDDQQPTITRVINFGNNSSTWAFDGECDDPRFRGRGMATTLLAEDTGRDAADCRLLFETGNIVYIG